MTAGVLTVMLVLFSQASVELPTQILPEGDGAWVVRIETSGGFTGRGAGSITASSVGEVLCVQVASCADRLLPETSRALTRLISTLPPGDQASPVTGRRGVCNDCITTTMTVRRRTREGERVQRYVWDSSTASAIHEEVRRLHSAIVALSPSRAR